MGWFSDDNSYQAEAYNTFNNTENHHEAKLSHELIAAAASYEGMKAYNEHCDKNGKPQSHEKAKEIAAGLAGAFVDRMVETKGMDWIDAEKVKHQSRQHIDECEELREQW